MNERKEIKQGEKRERIKTLFMKIIFFFFYLIPFNVTIYPETFSNRCVNSVSDIRRIFQWRSPVKSQSQGLMLSLGKGSEYLAVGG